MRAGLRLFRLGVGAPPQAVEPERIEAAIERLFAQRATREREPRQAPKVFFLERGQLLHRSARLAVRFGIDESAAAGIDADLDRKRELRGVGIERSIVRGTGGAVRLDQRLLLFAVA